VSIPGAANTLQGLRDNPSANEGLWKLSMRREALRVRACMLQSIRHFFVERDYLEIETPCRVPALIPEMHIDAVVSGDWFLHPSPEACMKRLLAAGFEKIFQICKCFREGERGAKHLPEFSMLEWYRQDADYLSLMEECQDLVISVSLAVSGKSDIVYQGRQISLHGSWERLSVREAFERYAAISAEDALRNSCFDEVMVCDIEPNLGIDHPTFLYEYPVSPGALAKRKEKDHGIAERFELYVAGLELANAFSELTDACEQQTMFKKVQEYRSLSGKTIYPMPESFMCDSFVIPESAGIALGLDRLAMILTDSAEIDRVVAFTPETL
jgi:elongation factor P--(R)-beta-lysine ligase